MIPKRVFAVANSHIDPVWLWDKWEGIDEVINTFRAACDRLDEYPALKFSASSACFYRWIETYAPDVFARIRRHVAAGRWEIVGDWWVETDSNLPLAVSLRKSAVLSRRYLRSRFGVTSPVAYLPDSFGHPASLPEILADTGYRYFIFSRPSASEKPDLPGDLFHWEHGGKRVLAYRLRHHYSQGWNYRREIIEGALSDADYLKHGVACYLFGLGDHGGGPTKTEIEILQQVMKEKTDPTLMFATCLEFFREAEKIPDLPVYSGDLHCHAIGCYSVNRNLKQAVRTAERALGYVERLGKARGRRPRLTPLWEKTIFNQFHDIMPGSCAPAAARQVLAELGSVHDACAQTAYESLKALGARVPVACRSGEFRIFNSLPFDVTGPFEIESFIYFRPGAPFKDSTGREMPIQEITASVNCGNRRWMLVDTLPAQSMKAYHFDSDAPPAFEQGRESVHRDGQSTRAGAFEIRAPGAIVHADRGPLFAAPLALGVVRDQSDTWSHGLGGFGAASSHFTPVSASVCSGSLASFLVSRLEHGRSSAELRFAAYAGLPFVDLEIKVRWEEERSLLKLEIEPARPSGTVLVQGPGSAIEKTTDGKEEPLHGWLQAGDLAVVQDGAFAFDRAGNRIRITLIRSSLYGYDQSWKLDPLGPLEHTDLGEHRFRFRFYGQPRLPARFLDQQVAAFIEPFQVIRSG